jgi:sulfotransferase domain protein
MMKMQYTLIPFSKYVYALVSRQKNKKIDFFIIGAQKCGTTSLHDYMNQHPFCTGALRKETLFFTKKYRGTVTLERLVGHFSFKKLMRNRGKCLFFESTPDNVYEEAAPGRIYKYNPKAKLIFLVREPVSRAISEYNMACKYAIVKNLCVREDPEREYFDYLRQPDKYPFEWFVKEEFRRMEETGSRLPSAFHYPDFIRHGLYSEQLERYLQYFSPEQILILESKSLKTDKRNTLSAIEDFLELPHHEWSEKDLVNSNIGVYTRQVPDECKLQYWSLPSLFQTIHDGVVPKNLL